MFSRHITSFYTSILISIIILIMYMASCKKLERIDLYAGHYFVFDLTRGNINYGDIADIKVFSSNRDEIPLWLKRRNQTFLHGLPVRPCQVKLNVLLFCQLYMQNIKLCGSYVVNFHVGYDPHGVFNRIHPFQKQGTHLDSDKKHLDCESSKQNNVVIHTYVVCVSETKLLSKVVQISLRYIHPLCNIYVSTEYDFSEAVKQMKSLSISDVRQIDKKCDLLQMYVSFISTCSDHATTKHNRVRRNANDDVTSFTTSGVLSRQRRDQWKVFFGSISALVGTPTETSTRIASSMQTISTLFTSSPIESLSPSLVITFSFPTSSTTVSIHTYSTTSDTCNTIVTSHASILQNKTWTSTPNITSISFLSTSHDRISQPISASTFKSTHPSSKKGPSFSSYTSEFTNTKNIITSHAVTFSETLASFNLTTSDLTTLILSLTSQARTFSSVSQTRAFSSGSFGLSRIKSFMGSPLSSSEMQSTSLFITSYGRSSSTTNQTLRSLLRANSTIAIFPSQSILISTTYYLGANKTASVTAKMLSSEKQSYQTVMVTFTSVGTLSQLSSVSFIRSIKTTHAISVSRSLNYSSVYLILSSSLPNSSITNVKPSNSTLSQIHSSMNSPKAPITSEISRFPKKTIIPSFVSTFTIHPYSTIPFSSYASTASFITLSPSKPVLKTVSEHLTDTRFSTYETVTSFRSLNQVTRRSTSTFSRSTNSKYLQSIESSRSDKIPTLSGTILSSITYSRIVDSLSPIKSTVNKILTTSRTILSSYFSDRKTSLPTSIIDSNILTSSGTSLSKTLTTFTTISSSFFRRTTGSFVNQTSVSSAGKSIFSTSSSINTTRIISRTLGLSSLKSLPTISIDRSVISQNYISTNKKRNSETNSLPITVEKSTMMSHPVSIMSRRIGSSTILSSLKMIISKFATSTSSITSALNTMSVLPSFVTSPSYSPVFTQNFSSNFITNASLTVSTNPESTRNYSLYRSTVLESISNIPIFTISPSKSQLRIATPSTQISIPTLKTSALIASDSTFPLSVSASFDPSVFVSNIASTRTFFNTQKPSTDITVVVDSSLFTSSKPPNTLQITSLKIHPTTSYYNSTFSTTNNFSSKIIQSTEISRDVAPSTSTAVVMSLSMSLSKSLVVSVESLGQTSTLFLSPVSSQTMETKPQILSSSVNKNSDNTPTYLYATIPDLSITYPSSMDMISSSTATTSLSVSLKASSVSTTKILPTKVARTSKPTRVTQYSTSQSIQISRSLSTFHPISVNSTHSSKVTPVSFTPSTFSPPSSKTPTTPQPSSETPTTPTGTPNFKPVVVSPIGHQFAHAGRLFTYQISENTFKDFEDGNTRNLTLTASLFNGEDLKNSWLSFNSSSQRFSGIPLQPDFSDTKLNPLSIVVTAFDRFGKSVSDNFFIVISQPIRTLTFGVTVTLAIDFNVFKRHKELNVLFLQKLKEYFSIPSVEDLYISSIVNGSTKITWSETTSGIKTCNRSSTSNIFSMVQNPATNTPNVEFARFMLPLFPVIGIDTEYLGVCLVNTTPTPVITSSMGVPVSDGNSTTDSYLYYAIPIIILAVVVIVILLILAYFWRYRKKSDRKYKNPFFIPNKPVLFPDEIELQQVPITTKVVSDNLTNAAFEEDAFDGGSVVSNSNSDYSSYSSNYSHKEEPPPYMLPPAYVQRFFNTESDV